MERHAAHLGVGVWGNAVTYGKAIGHHRSCVLIPYRRVHVLRLLTVSPSRPHPLRLSSHRLPPSSPTLSPSSLARRSSSGASDTSAPYLRPWGDPWHVQAGPHASSLERHT